LAEQNAWQGDLLVRGRDGATLMLGLSVRRIYDSKNSERYDDLYVGRDITEQKKKERDICLQEKVATRAEMAGEISHELNNYLSIAMGNLELMGMNIERGKFDNLGARINSVREGMTRIAKFVEELMAVPKPECRRDMFDLCQFLEDEVFYFKSLSKYQDIEFACDWGENVPAITGDRCRLQQAIYNILLNAADALSQGRVEQKRITLGVSHSQPDDMITIAISDNGPGMTQEDYQRLFRQFFSTKGQGHGFGLLAAKGAVKSFGGKVSAAPGPDGGACFTISIPGQKAAQPSGKSTMVPA
jgi:signal transduction histidine kinase